MSQVPVLDFQDFIAADGEKLTTDSRRVAAVFGKRHDHVLDKIRVILKDAPSEFTGPNFRVSEYSDATGRVLPMYLMTKDGFSLLAMGFGGKKAMFFKIAYIGAFNAMATFIANRRDGLQFRYFEAELEFKGKKRVASKAGRVLREWRDDKALLTTKMDALTDQMNPQLALLLPSAATAH